MSNEDPDVREFLKNAFDAMGINVIPSSRYQTHNPCDDGIRTILSTGEIKTEMVMLAVGRIPSSKNLNLEASGVKVDDRNYIEIDEYARTNVPHIFAVGDIGNRNVPSDLSLVHVAEAEGRCAAAKILNMEYPQDLDQTSFTHPCVLQYSDLVPELHSQIHRNFEARTQESGCRSRGTKKLLKRP